jgi:hypothetical protein
MLFVEAAKDKNSSFMQIQMNYVSHVVISI